MAINLGTFTNFNGIAAQPLFDRARRNPCDDLPGVPDRPPAGSLVVVDQFQDTWEKAAHGNVGTFAAQQHGFRGKVFAENIGPDQAPPIDRTRMEEFRLNGGPLDAAATRQAVRNVARYESADLLTGVAGDLDKLRQKGLHDSAVNVSYGTTAAGVADRLLGDTYSGGQLGSPNQTLSQNILNAYKIDPAKLGSQDSKVSGPEMKRLQDGLLQDARAGANHPEVKQAQLTYDTAVRGLQDQHNSVVVSAGNQQELPKFWKQEAKGNASEMVPSDLHNLLANGEVTTVGATRWFQGPEGLKERVAGYSNQDPTVDVYASGSVGNGLDVNQKKVAGTSYAAPRVAATLATLHSTHPGASAGQMRNLLNNRLTHDLPGASAPVLDFQAAEQYMRKGTF